jgi:anthranilate phosphoribosyltransferase
MCQAAIHEALKVENPLQIASFLLLLRAKGETPEELSAIISVLREKMLIVPTKHKVLDIVGTGGDHSHTVNISTGSAILAASCGVKVAKHGHRAVSSLTGAADVLEALGIMIAMSPEQVSTCIDQVGIGFCFYPVFHPVMTDLRMVGRQLKVASVLNFIGPILNPAQAKYYVFGIFNSALALTAAEVLRQVGCERAMVVHGHGMDEFSSVGPTTVIEVTPTVLKEYVVDPADFGFAYCKKEDLRGGDAKTNAQLLEAVFSGKQGPIADTLILNAAAALYLYGQHASIADAIPQVKDSLYSGKALTILNKWREFSRDQQ